MQIFFSFYQLKRKRKSNSQVHSDFQGGALLKVVDDDGSFGVSDLCPWPELGDSSLIEEITQNGPLYQRAIELAQQDLQARQQKQVLIVAAPIKNHILVTEFENFHFQNRDWIYKIKGSKDYKSLATWLNKNQHLFEVVRLDFNSCLTAAEFKNFLEEISKTVLKKIDVVEDPFPFEIKSWTEIQKMVPLAADFETGNWASKVVKPARQQPNSNPVYFTSSMDHPVGVAQGFRFAQQLPEKVHGFLTLDIYTEDKYSKAFVQDGDQLNYLSDGFGIGFTTLLAKENWVPNIRWNEKFDTVMLFNPAASEVEIKNLFQIKNEFRKTAPTDHVLLASSGSTQKPGNLKVFAFHKSAILNSAQRVVKQFNLTAQMHWGCLLPLFHVGGLGILARAHVAQSKIFYSSWADFSVDWIVENAIQLLSLVPTQVVDLVNCKINAPKMMKYVFVGGASLDPQVERAARELGWPLVMTYGMTETASMIAVQNSVGQFQLLTGVKLAEQNSDQQPKYFVQADSIASVQIDFVDGKISQKYFSIDSGVELPDIIKKDSDGSFAVIGRKDDQIKIYGELVNVARIKSLLPTEFSQIAEIVALPDARKGHSLILVGEQVPIEKLRFVAEQLNQNVKKFEKIDLIVTLNQFPRSALGKIKMAELKNFLKARSDYERL